MKHRIVIMLVCAALIAQCLAGCVSAPKQPEPTPETASSTPTPTPEPTPELTPSPTSTPTPTETPEPKPQILPEKQEQYAEYIARNADFTGWLEVPNTKINDPVVYASDYVYYVENNFDQKPSVTGAVFLDYNNLPDMRNRHTILYAHHMKNGTMFGSLKKYKNIEFLRENPVFTYDTLYGTKTYQVFSVLIVPGLYNYRQLTFNNTGDFLSFTDHMRALSLFSTNLPLKDDDDIITLSTCWYDFKDARFAIQAVLLPEGSEGIDCSYEVNENRITPWDE